MIKLSILIPSRNEEWLAETLADLIKNKNDVTEIIVVIDGEEYPKELPTHKDLTIIKRSESRGQRASTNEAAKIARGKYLMKTDAHTAWDKDFDLEILKCFEDLGDDITQVPIMRNLHVFDWVCADGHRRYQSPSGNCTVCGKETHKDVVWIPKRSPQSSSYRFDSMLHFQYFNEFKKYPEYEAKKPYTETMSLQGSCFILTREKYWELDICEEKFGSWGAQGTEVACKTWLSGGRVICNHNTWYAHLFRTQGGDFSFPYKQNNTQVEQARDYSRKLFLDNNWPLQKYPLSWLVNKFKPVPGWHDEAGKDMLEKIEKWGNNFSYNVVK